MSVEVILVGLGGNHLTVSDQEDRIYLQALRGMIGQNLDVILAPLTDCLSGQLAYLPGDVVLVLASARENEDGVALFVIPANLLPQPIADYPRRGLHRWI